MVLANRIFKKRKFYQINKNNLKSQNHQLQQKQDIRMTNRHIHKQTKSQKKAIVAQKKQQIQIPSLPKEENQSQWQKFFGWLYQVKKETDLELQQPQNKQTQTKNSSTKHEQNKDQQQHKCRNQEKQQQLEIQKSQIQVTPNLPPQKDLQKPQAKQFIFDKSLPQLLLIGKAGVGKTRLFNQLQPNRENESETGFQTESLKELVVVDTPSFELDDSIDEREARISQFQAYLIENQNSISTFVIVVNFESIDFMKQKIYSVYKYLRKFSQQIVIIITDWELSENKADDEKHLRETLKALKCKIQFVENNTGKEKLVQLLIEIVLPVPKTPIDLNETIFEIITDEKNKVIQEQLNAIARRIENQNSISNSFLPQNFGRQERKKNKRKKQD